MKKTYTAIFLLFLSLYILPLGLRPMIIPDESRYAEIPREMHAGGDWTVPRLNGIRYFEKPVMGYWLITLSFSVFGESAFSARLPSALAAGLSALLILLLARKYGEDELEATLALALALLFPLSFFVGVFNVLDSMLTMFITGSMVTFFFAYMSEKPAREYIFLALFGIFCGLAFLTKGFLAFAVPAVAIFPFLLWQRRWGLFKRSWIAVIAVMVVALPWAILVHFRAPDFWNYFFWQEHVARFFNAQGGQHEEPIWYYIPFIFAGTAPWCLFFPVCITQLRKESQKPLIRFCICWALFPFLFFSLSSGKLATYLLPCFPPLAILFSSGLVGYFRKVKKPSWFNIGAAILSAAVGIAALGLVAHQSIGFPVKTAFGDTETYRWMGAALALVLMALALYFSVKTVNYRGKIALFCLALTPIFFCVHFAMPERARNRKCPGEMLRRNAHRLEKDAVLVSYKDLAPAVCWTYKRDDVYLLDLPGEFEYGLKYDDCKKRLLTIARFCELLKNSKPGGVALITRRWQYYENRHLLPEPKFKEDNGYFVFVQF